MLLLIISKIFQFHKGTIKTTDTPEGYWSSSAFQFHKGTIKTMVSLLTVVLCLQFQFHKGTIKTHYRECDEEHRAYFNSIKVRLKRMTKHYIDEIPLFQFHKGTIKTHCFVWTLSLFPDFNSIKVRLKPSILCRCLQ